MSFTLNFNQIFKSDASLAGGKGASLGEMTSAGIPVPSGFVVLSSAFEKFLEGADLNVEIDSILHAANHKEMHTVENASDKIKDLILKAKMPQDIKDEIKKEFKKLKSKYVAVRSSATAEDSSSAAWAGQLDSFLNTTEKTLLANVQKCWASLFPPRAIFYRFEKSLHDSKISVAVVIQKMIESEVSGIAFSVHPVTQDRNQLIIEAGYGLGEAIVSGQITPDSYVIEKNPRRIIDKNVSLQERGIYRKPKEGGNEWQNIPQEQGEKQKLTDDQILELSELILKIENHYGFPVDIEWAFENDKFYIRQSRPITTLGKSEKISEESLAESLKKIDWDVQRFNAYPFFLSSTATLSGFNLAWGLYYKHFLIISHNKNIEWHYDKDDYNRIGDIFWDKVKTLKDLSALIKEYRETYEATIKNAIYVESELNDFSIKELKNILQKQVERLCASGGIAHIIECATSVAEQKLLNEFHIDPSTIKPSEPSFLKKAEVYAHELCNSEKSDKEILKKFKEKYAWIQSSYLGRNEISAKTVYELSHKLDIGVFNLGLKHKETDKQKFAEIVSHIFSWQDERKGNILESIYISQPVLEALARETGISQEAIKFLLPEEINKITDGEFQQLLIERSNLFVDYAPNNLQRISLVGTEAQKFIDKFAKTITSNNGVLNGQVAFAGRVNGVVRICLSLESINNFKTGEILVASMTRPEYISAMKKAVAFVTDEGGITCHAAIVSRELGKPLHNWHENRHQSFT